MSFRRKKYDGDFTGSGSGSSEWGNTFSDQSEIAEFTAPKRANRNIDLSDQELFAEDIDRDRYIITYADLLTLLLGLFIILYAVSNIDIQKYEKMMHAMGSIFGKEGKPDGIIGLEYQRYEIKDHIKELTELRLKLQQLILENNYDSSVNFEENERGLTIHILGDVLFPPGSGELGKEAKEILERISAIIIHLPNYIRVEGHSDNRPVNPAVFHNNWQLSAQRALNTAGYLIEFAKLSPERISIAGMADSFPVSSNETAEGRKANRRVDIIVLK